MKHSTKPNGITRILCVDGVSHLCVFALRDIKAGEQILYHYGSTNLAFIDKVISLNFPGGTILPGFLFQKRYNNCATCCCLGTREAAGGHDARRRLMGCTTDLQAWVSQHNCALWWKRSKLKCSWSHTNVLDMTVRLRRSHEKARRGNIFLSTSADSDLNMIQCQ